MESIGRGLVAVAYQNGSICVVDMKRGTTVQALVGHTEAVLSLSFTSLPRPMLASTGRDKTVYVWDTDVFEPLHVLKGIAYALLM